MKMYDPAKDSVKVLLGSAGQEGRVDGTPRTLVHLRTCKAYVR